MSKAEQWLNKQKENDLTTPRWRSKGVFYAAAELVYRGTGSAALVAVTSGGKHSVILAPMDAVSLGKWLLEMYGEEGAS